MDIDKHLQAQRNEGTNPHYNKRRYYIVFEKTLPDDNQLNDLCVRYYERRDEFYRLIESEFKSTYS